MAGKPTYEELERKVKELEKKAGDHKAIEEAFQKSLEKYHAVFETAKDAIFICDETGKFVDINQAACKSLGYSKEELLQLSNKEIDADEKGYEAFLKVRNGPAEKVTFEVNQRRKNGTLLPVEITGSFFDCKGERLAVAIARNITERKQAKEMLQKAHDKLERRVEERTAELSKANAELKQAISEHKQAEEALRESEAQRKAILDSSIDRIRLVDTDMRMIWANKTTTRELNIAPEDLVGQPCYKIFFDRDAPCAGCPSKKAVTSGNIEHAIMHHQHLKGIEGETYWDNYSVPIKNESGDTVNLIQIARNITDQVLSEQALQESEKKYRTLFEQSKDAIYITKREGEFIDVNQSFLDLFDYTKEEITEMEVQEIYIDPDDRFKFKKQVEQKGSVKDFEVKLWKKDGAEMDCLTTATVRRANDGSILGYQGIIRDITEHKRAEQALREKEEELNIKTNSLEEVNTALRVLLKRRGEDKRELEENVLSNVKELVVPFLEKVKNSQLSPKQLTYINIVESNLNEIISPFLRNLSSKWLHLTPTEIRVAHLIKEGKTTKETGEMMALSLRTIETHRKNMRKKLGIEKNKGNLRSHLLTLQ